jgi:hypothetical protein
MIGIKAATIVALVESFKPAMPKAPDHPINLYSDNCHLSKEATV